VRVLVTITRTIALSAGALCLLTPGESSAQLLRSARATSVYFRAGPSLLGFNPESVSFRYEGRRGGGSEREFSGKQLELGHPWVVGASLGVNVDARWFYVRVGADILQNPSSASATPYTVRHTTLGWISAGPRLVLGAFALQAGARFGALVMNVGERREGQPDLEYSGVEGLYALEIGAQWRPLRWVQVDVSAGQDFFGSLRATTVSLAVNVGWSRAL
jgi:hypothetical protein